MMRNLYIFLILALLGFRSQAKEIRISINGSVPVFTTDSMSPSVTFGMGIFRYGWAKYLNNPKLLTLSRGLAPVYVRLGGTRADHAQFIPDAETGLPNRLMDHKKVSNCLGRMPDENEFEQHKMKVEREEEIFRMKQLSKRLSWSDWSVNYTAQQFDYLMDFVHCVNWKLIFGLNLLTRTKNRWNPANTLQLLQYAKTKQYRIDYELGNEPNSYPHKEGFGLSAKDVAKGFYHLNEILKRDSWWKDSKLIGPDVNCFFRLSSRRFLKKFLQNIGYIMDAVTFHQYYVNSRTATIYNFTDPTVLNVLVPQVKHAVRIVRGGGRKSGVWLGETSSAFGGGANGLSNTYVSGFMWLDKLGICSRYGVDVVFRQSLFKGFYALLDDNFDPRPDYWLTLLYKRLVGPRVLDVKVGESSDSTEEDRGRVRIYAHCTNPRSEYSSGSITIYYLNLSSRNKSLKISPPTTQQINYVDAYILTSSPGNLNSSDVYLNGNKISMPDVHNLPPLPPKIIHSTSRGVRLPMLSFGFLVLPDVRVSACL